MNGTSFLISSGPMTSESMPSSLLTYPPTHRAQRAVVVGEGEMTALGEHDVEIEVRRQRLVEPDRAVVEPHAVWSQVVGTDDGRVASRASATDIALVDDRHPPNAVVGRKVVRGCEPVDPGADHHDVVYSPQFVGLPDLRPLHVGQPVFDKAGGRVTLSRRTVPGACSSTYGGKAGGEAFGRARSVWLSALGLSHVALLIDRRRRPPS